LKNRIFGIDLIRTFIFFIIVSQHCAEVIFADNSIFNLDPSATWYSWIGQNIQKVMAFSGLALTSISFFLMGHFNTRIFGIKLWYIFGGLIAMSAGLRAPINEWTIELVTWGVYSYLFASFMVIAILGFLPNRVNYNMTLIAISILWLSQPTDSRAQSLLLNSLGFGVNDKYYESALTVLYGGYPNDYSGWGLLPWLGLPVLTWAIGRLSQNFSKNLSSFNAADWLWLSIPITYFALGAPLPSKVYAVSPADFYFQIFEERNAYNWLWFSALIFFIRISLLDDLNSKLSNLKIVKWNSMAMWNRHFAAFYLCHFIVLQIGRPWREFFLSHPRLFDFYWLAVIIATEALMRLTFGWPLLLQKYSKKSRGIGL
jgi:hypothetical protein